MGIAGEALATWETAVALELEATMVLAEIEATTLPYVVIELEAEAAAIMVEAESFWAYWRFLQTFL